MNVLLLLLACHGGVTVKDPPVEADTDTDSDTDVDTDSGTEDLPGSLEPWDRSERWSPGSITFTELAYAPADPALEWVEIHNPMAMDMDLSGWALEGGVAFTFPEGTWIEAGDYLVIAADPGALGVDALGPYTGSLDDGGEDLQLTSNGGRRIDALSYGDDEPWPVGADGTGATMTKMHDDDGSASAETWTASREVGGTPGAASGLDPLAPPTTVTLVELESDWQYDAGGGYPASTWAEAGYDDSAWSTGTAVFYGGGVTGDTPGTIIVTADNYYGVYLGSADGTNLRLVGEDADGAWWTAESFEVDVGPEDHLYLAAWEAPTDYGGPQMTIAEVDFADSIVGTAADTFEWVLGPTGGCPGTTPPDPPPDEAELLELIDAGGWQAPAVEATRGSSPWGSSIQGYFDDSAQYVWPDTFSDTSVTNTENTYALFRSVDPLVGPGGGTEIDPVPTTTLFRTRFTLDADPSAVTLSLSCELDDGAVFYLNGVEALREAVPSGTITADTLASEVVTDSAFYATLPTTGLVRGENVLAVEVHQAESTGADLRFGCEVTATIAASAAPTLRIDELSAGGDTTFWAELLADGATDLDGLILAAPSGEVTLSGSLGDGERALIEDLPAPEPGDVLALYSADRAELLDAVRVSSRVRGRSSAGDWQWPTEETPGEPNVIELTTDVVINELMYHRAPYAVDGEPIVDRDEEWIELYNRGDAEIDVSGWQISDAVTFLFPAGTVLGAGEYLVVANDAAAFAKANPGVDVLGDFDGALGNDTDRVLLLDANGNPADAVRYYDNGRWPEAADGGGCSLERRSPFADPAAGEAWAASDESARTEWVDVSYDADVGASAVGPDGQWEELVLGLLDAGEVLLDDVSVIEDPDGAAREVIQDGTFDDPDRWRIIGNHRHSEITTDPDDSSDSVLRLVATGPTEHMHNHAETTLSRDIRYGTYRISYRARWVSGSNQLNTRLYFNRGARTVLLPMPDASGTPGAANSTYVDNLGPTFTDFGQDVAVPEAGQPVTFSVTIDDPDGVTGATLWSSVDGGAFTSHTMTGSDGTWSGTIDGEAGGSIVQVYVEAEDSYGESSTFPAAGPDSRALVRFDGGEAATNGLHNLRILLTEADSDWMLDDPNLMSNDLVGATIVYDEREVFYDVGARTKGSERGRPETVRLGYGLHFSTEQPFRGTHTSVLVDRSEGVNYGQREVLMNLVAGRAGLVSAEYNDLVQAITPRSEHTGPAELQLDRFTNLVLEAQFADGDEGVLHDYELIYYPYTTDDNTAEGNKLPQPDSVIGTWLVDLGEDKEAWRWNFGLQNHQRDDEFDGIMRLGRTFGGSDLLNEAPDVIDVDLWLRAFAFATLVGATDNYAAGAQHNAAFYVRPEDGRVLYFPHDLDYFGGSSAAVVGSTDLSHLIADTTWHRLYYQHLQDIIERAYNRDAIARWCDQLGDLLPSQSFESHCDFVEDRATYVTSGAYDGISAEYPSVTFAITTNSGADFSTSDTSVTLAGQGWIDVREIRVNDTALDVTWTSGTTWEVTVPLEVGDNDLVLTAWDIGGASAGSDEIGVRRE